jgi:hypothetical protein
MGEAKRRAAHDTLDGGPPSDDRIVLMLDVFDPMPAMLGLDGTASGAPQDIEPAKGSDQAGDRGSQAASFRGDAFSPRQHRTARDPDVQAPCRQREQSFADGRAAGAQTGSACRPRLAQDDLSQPVRLCEAARHRKRQGDRRRGARGWHGRPRHAPGPAWLDSSYSYLKALVADGAQRHNVDGQAVEPVALEHQAKAAELLAVIEAKRAALAAGREPCRDP